MTLRKKTIWIIGIVLCLLFIIIFGVAAFLGGKQITLLEEREAHINAQRAVNSIGDAISKIDASVGDWSKWDDSYAFMENRNTAFLKSNVTNEALKALGINLLLFVDTAGRVVIDKCYDLQKDQDVGLPKGVDELFAHDSAIEKHKDDGLSGIIMLADAPMMFVTKPILTSEAKGPSRGLVMMGRWLDAAELARLSRVTNLRLELHEVGLDGRPIGMPEDIRFGSKGADVVIRKLDKQFIAAYAPIRDVNGIVILLLKVTMPREVAQLGESGIRYLAFAMVSIGIVFILLVIFILEKMVLSRITWLSTEAVEIGARGDIGRRLLVHGEDELTRLAQSINIMLDSLQRAQNGLSENEERLNAMLESTQAGFLLIDARDHTIIDLNRAAAAMIGLPKEEIAGLLCHKFVCPAELGKCPVTDLGMHVDNSERILLKADGSSIPILKSVNRIRLGGRDVLVESFIDISDRKRAEEISQQLAAIVESSDDAIIGKTLEGIITSWNKGAERIYGYAPWEVIGQNISILVPPDHADELPVLLKRITAGEAILNYETRRMRKDGQLIDVSLTLSPIHDSAGKIIGISTIARDITEHKRAEEKLRLAGEELVRMSNMKSEFTSMVTHELRTPLSAIKEAINMVLDGVHGALNEKQVKTLGIASRNINRLARLTTDVLDFTKLESGKMQMFFAQADLGEILKDVYEGMKPVAEKGGVSLTLGSLPENASVVCDADRIRQVVDNLVNNALKFTREGGSVKMGLAVEGGSVRIDVEDTGIGIKESDLAKMFQVFGQVYSKDTGHAKGSGLGLVISKQIMEAHGGDISVQSVYGKGSQFTVTFPADLSASRK